MTLKTGVFWTAAKVLVPVIVGVIGAAFGLVFWMSNANAEGVTDNRVGVARNEIRFVFVREELSQINAKLDRIERRIEKIGANSGEGLRRSREVAGAMRPRDRARSTTAEPEG